MTLQETVRADPGTTSGPAPYISETHARVPRLRRGDPVRGALRLAGRERRLRMREEALIMMSKVTASDVMALAEIVGAAWHDKTVVWFTEDLDEVWGTARHIVVSPDNPGFLRGDADVRKGYLRVTGRDGWDRYYHVGQELLPAIKRGTFIVNPSE